MRPKVEWAIDSEAMRARGIIVLVKSNWLVKKLSRLNIFRKLKLDFNPFLRPKHYKYGGRFRYYWINQSERSMDDRPLVGFY